MTKKHNQPSPELRPEKVTLSDNDISSKRVQTASASARSGLLGAVSLLGVSLGVADAAPLDAAGPAASAKDAVTGEKLVQSVTIKFDKSRKAQKESRQHKIDKRRRKQIVIQKR